MSQCPLLNFKTPQSVLSDRTNVSQHPWEKTIKNFYYDRIKRAHNSVRNPIYPILKEDDRRKLIKFTVIGIRTCKEFVYCANLVKGMHKYRSKTFDVPEIRGVSTADWPSAWNNIKLTHGGFTYCITTPVIILRNGEFFGGDQELKEFIESKYIYRICLDYRKEAMEEFSRYVKSTGRPFAYMHISIDENHIGTLIFMLYSDIVPNTCENFLRLCKTRRGGYSGSPVHRVVKDGWIQCGGFALRDSNLGCENFVVPHNRRGVVSMCNDGRNVDCSTQFFVLLRPCEWMDHKYVAFGQLVDGVETLKKIENVSTFYEAPTSSIIIDRAGVLNLDCEDITTNNRVREYINKHIENLIESEEFFIELLLQHVWAAVGARQKEVEQQKEKLRREQSETSASSHTSRVSLPSIKTDEVKENQEFAVESYSMLEAEECPKSLVHKSSTKSAKPFYVPLTDVPYPGEVDSTFDLKKFLRGDYCLESDLQKDLAKDEKQREVLKIVYSNLPSDLFLFDEHEYIKPDEADIDSSEEDEIVNYIKNNVDRVSFAGEVIKNIGTVRKGHAMFNLFDEKRKSELPLVTDDDLKKLRRVSVFERRQSRKQSEIPNFTDEDMRKLRRASAIERGTVNPYERRQSTKKVSMAPSVHVELPKLIGSDTEEQKEIEKPALTEEAMRRLRRASQAVPKRVLSEDRMSMASKISDESTESEELPKIVDPEMIQKMKRKSTFDKRRQSVVDPLRLRSESPIMLEGIRKSQLDKLRRISMFDADQESKLPKPRDSSIKESFDKKRRQTVFAKELAKVQSFQDVPSEDSSSNLDLSQQKCIRFPSGTQETHKEIKRRQTGYIHEEDLDKLNIGTEDQAELNIIEGGAIKLAIPVKEEDPQTIERRQTAFIRPTPSLLEEIEEISAAEHVERTTTGSISSTLTILGDISSKNLFEAKETDSLEHIKKIENEFKSWDKKKERRHHSSQPTKVVEEDDLAKIAHLRESVFLRLYEDALTDRKASPPTLKHYKPMSELIPNTKNMFLTFGKGIHFDLDKEKSPLLRRSKTIDSDFSFVTMSGMKFGRRTSPPLNIDYQPKLTEKENPLLHSSFKSRNKHSKRPLITVEDYQRKNRERLEKLKETEALKIRKRP